MSETADKTALAAVQAPSKQKILIATVIALLAAMVLLFTIILPAEYGVDPLGTGRALGLTQLASAGAEAAPTAATSPTSVAPGTSVTVIQNAFHAQPAGYKVDSREIQLAGGEGMELKYYLAQGAGMVYSWTSNETLFFEFHAEPDTKPAGAADDYYETYEKDDQVGAKQGHGTFIAPSSGIHGWYWENQSGAPATIKLVTAGFYESILEFQGGGKRMIIPADPK
jgi:hypothetical protein